MATLRDRIISQLSSRVAELTETEIQWAVDRGYARRAEVSFSLESVESWQSDWRSPDGGSWPCCQLRVSVDGAEVGTVTGWHFVGYVGPGGGYQRRTWVQLDSDGATNGRVKFEIEPGDAPRVGGAEGQDYCYLPVVGMDGRALVYDGQEVNDAAAAAGDEADHGGEPSIEDLDVSDGEDVASIWVIRDYAVHEVRVVRIDAYPDGEVEDNSSHYYSGRCRYLLTGYAVVDGDDEYDVCGSVEEAVRKADVTGDDGRAYETEEAARQAWREQTAERIEELDDLPGMIHDYDDENDGALYIVEQGNVGQDTADYVLDDSDITEVCRHGWKAIVQRLPLAVKRKIMGVGDDMPAGVLADLLFDAGLAEKGGA